MAISIMIMLSIFSACFAGQCGRGEGSETKAARPTNTAHFHVRMSLRKILRTAVYECDHAPTVFFLTIALFHRPDYLSKCLCMSHKIIEYVYLLLPVLNLRDSHPIACSGKPNPAKATQSHLHIARCI